jgi:hypothetical protein
MNNHNHAHVNGNIYMASQSDLKKVPSPSLTQESRHREYNRDRFYSSKAATYYSISMHIFSFFMN